MRELLIVEVLLTAAAAVMAMVLCVVCILYATNLDASPRLAAELPGLVWLSLGFAVPAALGAAACWTLHRRRAVLPFQIAFLLSLGFIAVHAWEFANA